MSEPVLSSLAGAVAFSPLASSAVFQGGSIASLRLARRKSQNSASPPLYRWRQQASDDVSNVCQLRLVLL